MTEEPSLDSFWSSYFADYLTQGKTVTQALKSINGVHIQQDNIDVDFALWEHIPDLREIWLDVPGTRFKNLEVLPRLPKLREVWIRAETFAQSDLELVTANSKISKLHMNCSKLRSFGIDGSVEHDFSLIRDLPITGVSMYLVPSQAHLDAMCARLKETWPNASTSARIYWNDDQPEPVRKANRFRDFWARLFAR